MKFDHWFACACLAACLAPNASGAGKIRFDPTRDLPGFEGTRATENKDLYPLDGYEEMLGLEMDEKTLAEVQAKWKAESAVVQQHLDLVRTDPTAGVRWLVETRMAKHPFFSKIRFTVDASVPPFLIFVQTPSFDDPVYAPSVVKMLAPFLAKLVTVFDEHVQKPTGQKRQPDRPLTPLVILASPGDLQNYLRLGTPADGFTRSVMFDARLGVVVSAINSFDKLKATTAVVHPLMREAFLALLRAYVTPPLKDLPSMWAREGLAGAFTYPRGAQVEALDKPEPRIEDLKTLVENCHHPQARTTLLMPVSVLASLSSWDGLWLRAYGPNIPAGAAGQTLATSFTAQSSLWAYFLARGRDGKYRARFDQYLKLAMSGQSGADALSLAFVDIKLADLDRDFWSWVYDEHARLVPDIAIDKNDLVGLFDPVPKEGVVDELVARAKKSLGPEVVEPPFAPATLAIGENDVESRHGLALRLARSGDLESARAALETLAKGKPTAPDDGRIARDLQRLSAAIALRDGFLGALIAKSGRLSLEINGKKVNAPVSKVENGAIVFGENSFGATTVPLSALDPLEMARQAEKKEQQGTAPAWTRAWLYLLAEDARWEKLLKLDSDEARDVKADGSVWYHDRLQAGLAAALVDRLAHLSLPKTRAEAEPIVATIRELLKMHAEAACVLLKKPALERFGRAALEVLATDADGSEFVHGKFSKTSDGIVTVAYEFDAETEALDFNQNKGHLLEWRKGFASGDLPEEGSVLAVKGGFLNVSGNAMWRMPIGFSAPMTLRADFAFPEDVGKVTRPPALAFQICDNGVDTFVNVDSLGNINVVEGSTGATGHTNSSARTFFPGRPYRLEIVHDGTKVTASLDGNSVATLETDKPQGGGVEVLAIDALPIRINHLEITGKLDPASLVAARAAWVGKNIHDMGF